MKRDYEGMSRAELLKIATIHGIKNRHKMKKEELIEALKSKKKPLKEIKEVEKSLKKKPQEKYGIPHLELLPKEPGYVFVNWEVPENKELQLRIKEGTKPLIELPVESHGKGYFRVPEGSRITASVGSIRKDRFREIVKSSEFVVPVSKMQDSDNVKWVDVKDLKEAKKRVKETEEMRKEKRKAQKLAKKIKYMRLYRENQ